MAQKSNDVSHAGHRQRLKEQFREHGLQSMSDVTALEFLLSFALPRQDTNPIAHRLIDTFGSLERVFDAPCQDLTAIQGISDHTACLLKLVMEMANRVAQEATRDIILKTTEDCGAYLLPRVRASGREQVYLLGLDAKCKALGCVKIFEGSVDHACFSTRLVAEAAMNMRATTVILAHSHPGGVAVPSDADVETTLRLRSALGQLGIFLADHMVVADHDYVSMAESGMMG